MLLGVYLYPHYMPMRAPRLHEVIYDNLYAGHYLYPKASSMYRQPPNIVYVSCRIPRMSSLVQPSLFCRNILIHRQLNLGGIFLPGVGRGTL